MCVKLYSSAITLYLFLPSYTRLVGTFSLSPYGSNIYIYIFKILYYYFTLSTYTVHLSSHSFTLNNSLLLFFQDNTKRLKTDILFSKTHDFRKPRYIFYISQHATNILKNWWQKDRNDVQLFSWYIHWTVYCACDTNATHIWLKLINIILCRYIQGLKFY